MKADLYNWKGEKAGSVEVSDAIFARAWNGDLVHQVMLAFEANQRRPWAHAKGRGEVRGGGIKPWKQKGTGRSRHGSIRSPIWKGGGASHGPVKDRDFSQKINKKMQRGAIHSVLSKKLAEGELRFVESMTFSAEGGSASGGENLKTKQVAAALKAMYASKKFVPSTLLVSAPKNATITRASRNIPKVQSVEGRSISIHDLLAHKNVLIDKAALSEIK